MYINRTVLLADDQSVPRHELREILRHTGCAVIGESRTTDDTLERFDKLQPDLVIIDPTLPGSLDALVVIQRMRRARPETMVLVAASASQQALLMEALTMGATDFILKPFQQRSVLSCLQRNVG